MIKNAKESHLRKAKGEKLQKEVVELIKHYFPEYSDNIESAPKARLISYFSDLKVL
jgi:hypothetical protein